KPKCVWPCFSNSFPEFEDGTEHVLLYRSGRLVAFCRLSPEWDPAGFIWWDHGKTIWGDENMYLDYFGFQLMKAKLLDFW
ncbi:hypothetical protein U1Q18_049143, partial [Sarracenia purpurea var. burkii]